MSRDKAEILSQRKLKSSNEIGTQRLLTKGEEKKTRESSIDRSNLNKSVSSKGATSQRKVDTKLNESTSRMVRSKERTVSSKATLRSNTNEKKKSTTSTTPRKNLVNATPKSMKTTTFSSKSNLLSSSSSSGTKASSRDVTSDRVTKQKYFPQKFSYSAHLLHDNKTSVSNKPAKIKDSKPERTKDRKPEIQNSNKSEMKINNKPAARSKIKFTTELAAAPLPLSMLNRERTMTRMSSPSEIKHITKVNILQEANNNNNEVMRERPRTATIRRHYDSQVAEVPSIENDYEDDFESYESDFETGSSSTSDGSIATDSSSSDSESLPIELTQKRNPNSGGNEEERKLDSGNYDLPDVKHKQILDKIKEAIEKENSEISKHKSNDSPNPASLSDEGFEDSCCKYSLFTNSGFINFTDAKKKLEGRRRKSRKRGDDLMNMIRLNAVSFSLFDMNPVTYEKFMQSYGRTGTIQMSTQTGDDDLDEQIQTEPIERQEKSTQYPIRFPKTDQLENELEEAVCKPPHLEDAATCQNISKFMSSHGKLILHILERKSSEKLLHIDRRNKREIPFSNGSFKLSYDKTPFLKNRTVTSLTYSKYGALLTVHASGSHDRLLNHSEELLNRSTICVWNVLKPNIPQKVLTSYGEITKACFDSSHSYLVFAGINDGALSVWDLRESSNCHRQIRDESLDKLYTMRTATYTTVSAMKDSIMIAIQSFPIELSVHTDDAMPANQICTLDEIGTVIIWSVIQTLRFKDDQGLVPWGRVVLVQGLVISLQKMNPNLKELHCFGMTCSEMEPNDLYITSNYGVLHCLSSGMKPSIKLHTNDKSSTVLCVEMSPFSATHILSGCENGNIHLYSRLYEKPLMTLNSNTNQSMIETIEWSNCRPCVFFIKDSANFFQVWDLTVSDMYPIYSIPFSENVTDIKCSPILPKQSTEPHYMAIATTTGEVVLHVLNNEYTEEKNKELSQFLNYVNRL